MTVKKACFCCYEPLIDEAQDYHKRCCRRLYGTDLAPEVDFGIQEVQAVAEELVHARLAVTGVQPKLSVELTPPRKGISARPVLKRVTLTGLWGRYILKPPHKTFPFMPEIEDISMRLAEICGIETALHGLVKLRSGDTAYIAKRFDRVDEQKLPLEDMCQLTGLLTEDKYHSSMENIGKTILRYSSNPGVDAITFLEVTVFSFLIGNADMHLKNFSLLTDRDGIVKLSPAYDLLATKLLTPDDEEEMALPINGKKNRLKKTDFIQLGRFLRVPEKAIENIFKRLQSHLEQMPTLIEKSFLDLERQRQLCELMAQRTAVLFD